MLNASWMKQGMNGMKIKFINRGKVIVERERQESFIPQRYEKIFLYDEADHPDWYYEVMDVQYHYENLNTCPIVHIILAR